jgi:methylthioribose-1-phosphate isomerase
MNIDNVPTRTIRIADTGSADASGTPPGVEVIDQTLLPHRLAWRRLDSLADAASAIREMTIRGAPLIGATAAYGVALAMRADAADAALEAACTTLAATRPTAVNLHWALVRMQRHLAPIAPERRADAAWQEAAAIADEDAEQNRRIGEHGLIVLRTLMMAKNAVPLNVMTHCNAGWLATVDHGTALAPIYGLHDGRWPVHVWVSETRPRNQGLLTAWELAQHGVPHTLIADNAAGLLLGSGRVDAVIVGADRIAANGDVANKIGTYLKALACADHGIPFYVAAPLTTIDWSCPDGAAIEIEQRHGDELRLVGGLGDDGEQLACVRQIPAGEPVFNAGFDVTPARLVTGIITERGVCKASRAGLAGLYPEFA